MKRSKAIFLSIIVILLISAAAKWLVFDTVLSEDPDTGRQRIAEPE